MTKVSSTVRQRSFLRQRSALPSAGHSPALMMNHASSKERNLLTAAKQPGKNGNGSLRSCPGQLTGDAPTLFDQELLNRLWSVYSKPKQGVGFLVRSAMVTYQLEVCMCKRFSLHSRQVSGDADCLLVTSKGSCTSEIPNVTHPVTSTCPRNFGNLRFIPAELRPMSCFNSENMCWDSEENAFRYFLRPNTNNFNNQQQSQRL